MMCALLPLMSITLPVLLSATDNQIQIQSETVLFAHDYGLVGDGTTDDGPALQKAMQALIDASKPATLLFEPDAVYYLKTGPNIQAYQQALDAQSQHGINLSQDDTYMILLHHQKDITIDGNGSTFLIDVTENALGFISLKHSENIILRNLSIDYHPLPFADGLIIAKNEYEGYIDVQIFDEFVMPPLGGPTQLRDEQAYYGMVWLEGPYSLLSHHYWLADIQEAYPDSTSDRIIRAFYRSPRPASENWDFRPFGEGVWGRGPLSEIVEGETVFTAPVRGVAHRGGREVFRIHQNTDVTVEQINVWSAPWMVFSVAGNDGTVRFSDVQVRPKPDTQRHSSSWRDSIHVTANYAELLFERVHLEGMNDDAFNIKTLLSRVHHINSEQEIQVVQAFPLQIVPWRKGDMVEVYSLTEGRLIGRRTVTEVIGEQETNWESGAPRAPVITLHLDTPFANLNVHDRIWNVSSTNTRTTIRDSVIKMSCRFQSSLTIENSDITALAWFYGESIEGPIPSNIVIRDSHIRLGRGNPYRTLIFNSHIVSEPPSEPVISNILLQNNIFEGGVSIEHAQNVILTGNRFTDTVHAGLVLGNSRQVRLQDNSFGQQKLQMDSHITFLDESTRTETGIDAEEASYAH